MIVIYGAMCKMKISPGVFFLILKFWFFRLSGELKGPKMAKNDKNFCRNLCFRNHIYHMILIYGTRVCTKGYYLQTFFFFFFFKILILKIRWGGEGFWWKGKRYPKMTKNSVCLTPWLINRASYDCVLYDCDQYVLLHISGTVDYITKNLIMIYTGVFLYFSLQNGTL